VKTDIINQSGKKVTTIDLEQSVFGIKENMPVVHQVVKAQMAGARAGNADTKGRAEVRGGGRKPWRQKGTGRARAGSIRSPLWKGGGTIFGPTPRSYEQKIPRKVGKLALRSILSAKAKNDQVKIIEKFELAKPSTKEAKNILEGLGINDKVTIVVADGDENVIKSVRNLPKARAITASQINAYDLTDCAFVVMTADALEKVTEVLSVEKR
jgi:large subunit ribosomal protein L4